MEMSHIVSNDMEQRLREYAAKYNNPIWFQEDPVSFPRRFVEKMKYGAASLKDVEIAAVFAAHLAWGRRAMIVRDCGRLFEEMAWKPYDYVMRGEYKSEPVSLHRTVMWSEFASICSRLRSLYERYDSLESVTPDGFRTEIYGQKSDLKAANKKIHMMRRWMVRRDGIVDFGLWKDTDPRDLVIPLDVHVHTQAKACGLTQRNSADYRTAREITDFFLTIFPDDPCLGDFALFGSGLDGCAI